MVEYKKCSGECGLEKELNTSNFRWRKDEEIWVAKCLICISGQRKNFRNKNRERINKEKNISYHKNKHLPKNKEKRLAAGKRYRATHKTEIKQYTIDNQSWLKPYHNNYQKNRAKNDPIFKLRKTISREIHKSLKNNLLGSITEYLPYPMEKLKKHLEDQFKSWMTWENWGSYNSKIWNDKNPLTWVWNIDHKKPQSHFDIKKEGDTEFLKCWALDNLRPYSAKKNVFEGDRRECGANYSI